jgi:hypothetical protein
LLRSRRGPAAGRHGGIDRVVLPPAHGLGNRRGVSLWSLFGVLAWSVWIDFVLSIRVGASRGAAWRDVIGSAPSSGSRPPIFAFLPSSRDNRRRWAFVHSGERTR